MRSELETIVDYITYLPLNLWIKGNFIVEGGYKATINSMLDDDNNYLEVEIFDDSSFSITYDNKREEFSDEKIGGLYKKIEL